MELTIEDYKERLKEVLSVLDKANKKINSLKEDNEKLKKRIEEMDGAIDALISR